MRFSIVIVVLNGEKTIQSAIESVLKQTFSDFELIIRDGLSNDNTISICKEYAEKDKRIVFISDQDSGIYDAMNKVIRFAKGEWIFFLGCDDKFYDWDTLRMVSEKITIEKNEMLYGNVVLLPGRAIYDGQFNYEKLLKRNISHQAIFYKKDLLDRLNGFNTGYPICADWDFNLRCFASPDVSISYVEMAISYFAKGGSSRSVDMIFFQESLLPRFTAWIGENTGFENKISLYDAYWRLVRNLKIKSVTELYRLIPNTQPPASVLHLVKFQNRFPYSILRFGFFSKLIMFLSFSINRLFKIGKHT